MRYRKTLAITLALSFAPAAAFAQGPVEAAPKEAVPDAATPPASPTAGDAGAPVPAGGAAQAQPESPPPPAVPAPSPEPVAPATAPAQPVDSDAPSEAESTPPPPVRLEADPDDTDSESFTKPAPPPPDPDAPPTLFDSEPARMTGGFGGVGLMYTSVLDRDSLALCAEGAVLINHTLSLGGGGCSAGHQDGEDYGAPPHSGDDLLDFRYGGFIGRYHLLSDQVVNLSLGSLIGAGAITISNEDLFDDEDVEQVQKVEFNGVFVVEPSIGLHLNVNRWFRIAALAGYRVVAGTKLDGLKNEDFSGLSAGLQLQFGRF